MVSYAKMTESELEKYREENRKEAKKRQEEWENKHPNGVDHSYRTPFDEQHHIPHYIFNIR